MVIYGKIGKKQILYEHEIFSAFLVQRNHLNSYSRSEIYDIRNGKRNPEHLRKKIFGMEDCKLFLYEKQLYCSFTSVDHVVYGSKKTKKYQEHQVGVGLIEHFFDEKKKLKFGVKQAIYLEKPDPKRVEKNWLPFPQSKNCFRFIYSLNPLSIKEMNRNNGSLVRNLNVVPLPEFSYEDFRGSAGPLPTQAKSCFKKGWLALTHEVCCQPDPKKRARIYTHRFLWYTKDFVLTKMSYPFYFWDLSIEYCNGMTFGPQEQTIVLSVGKFDKEAYLLSFETPYILLYCILFMLQA